MNYFYQRGFAVNSLDAPRKGNREDKIVADILKGESLFDNLTGYEKTALETALRFAYRAGGADAAIERLNRHSRSALTGTR
jgi:hypothetical protein